MYTKGEWKIDKLHSNRWDIYPESNPVSRVIAEVNSGDSHYTEITPAEGQANAYLIAATPEMYEALKGLLQHYSTNPLNDKFYEACLRAREALAKAGG